MNKTCSSKKRYARIHPDGTVETIYDDSLHSLLKEFDDVTITRASYVEPAGKDWFVDLAPVGGPIMGPYALREEALAAERDWIERNRLCKSL